MRLACVALLLGSGCYYDVPPAKVDLGDVDLSASSPLDLSGVDGAVCANGSAPLHAGELAEAPIDRWGAQAIDTDMEAGTTVSSDTRRVQAGSSSVRLDTTAPSAGLVYPRTRDAHFDLSQQLYVSFAVTADDSAASNDPGWKGSQPHLLVVTTSDDYLEFVPTTNRLSRTAGDFVGLTVPLAGGDGWLKNAYGTPDLSSVAYLAWTFDTWGAGFSVWLDDVQIGPAPFVDCGP